jgi:hypothetical protein
MAAGDLVGIEKTAEAVERLTRELRQGAHSLVGPAVEALGQHFAARVHIFLIPKAIRAVQIANEQIARSGLHTHRIDLKRLIPMLEGASLEEDEDLASKWAGLIASAATGSDTLPAFADILRQLTPEEARMIDFMFDNAADTPGLTSPAPSIDKADLREATALSEERFLVRIQNLH